MRPRTSRALALVAIAIGTLLGATASGVSAERTSPPPAAANHDAFAHRVFVITDLILENHIDPPTRQEMILGGIRGLRGAAKSEALPTLSRKVSEIRTAEELSALLNQVWPSTSPPASPSSSPGAKSNVPPKKRGERMQPEEAFLAGLFHTVPGGTQLVSVKEARAESQIQANRYVGLGIAIRWDDKEPFPAIQKLIEGGSAELGGMHEGDLIREIDHAPVNRDSLTLRDVVERLRGVEGSKVTLQLGHPDSKDVRTITFVRLPVMFRSVHEVNSDANIKFPDSPRIAMLRIDRVSASTAQELRAWEIKLQNAGVKGVVLDLRNVGDVGPESYHSAVLLADSLLDGKPIGKLRTRERTQDFAADRETLFREIPLAFLVNKHTGGAAEWVVAALQDAYPSTLARRHAVIVGQETHGANLITSAVPVPGDQEVLMLATAVWARPTQSQPNEQHAADGDHDGGDGDGDGATSRWWHVTPDIYVEPVKPAANPSAPAGQKESAEAAAKKDKKGEKPTEKKTVAGSKPPIVDGIDGDPAAVKAAIAELERQLKLTGDAKK
jgi:C-terminal peptidase prc